MIVYPGFFNIIAMWTRKPFYGVGLIGRLLRKHDLLSVDAERKKYYMYTRILGLIVVLFVTMILMLVLISFIN